jgi:hypothetical protein
MPGAAEGYVQVLHGIASAGGHISIAVSVQHYFHLPMGVLRAHADRIVERLLTGAMAATWAGLKDDALYKRVERAGTSCPAPKLAAVRSSCALEMIPCVTVDHPCMTVAEIDVRRPSTSLNDVLPTLQRLDKIRPQASSGAIPDGPLAQWDLAVETQRKELLIQFPGKTRLVNTRQDKLEGLRRYLEVHAGRPASSEICREWTERTKLSYVDVSEPAFLDRWLRFLKVVGVPPNQIVLRMTGNVDVSRLRRLEDQVAATLNFSLATDGAEDGYVRPEIYLQISSRPVKDRDVVPPAAVSMVGFHALMCAACVLQKLEWQEQREEA